MSLFTMHSIESAPTQEMKDALTGMKKAYGFVPNLGAVLAESPVALKALFSLYEINDRGTLTAAERQLVYVAASVANSCAYCAAAHSMLGAKAGLDKNVLVALKDSRVLSDPRLEALRRFTSLLVTGRGHVMDGDVAAFLAAGYTKAQIFEVLALVAAKIITNYANHMARTPLNREFMRGGNGAGDGGPQ